MKFEGKINLKGNPFYLSLDDINWIENTIDQMSLEEKVGQLFCLDIGSGSKKDLDDILKYNPGGVFIRMHFKSHNWKICKYLQENSKIPLLISSDLECGGLFGAINGTWFSTQMGVAATNNEDYAYKLGLVIGLEGTAIGFNWSYSPVLDINFNHRNPIVNVRSYGDKPDLIKKMAISQIKGIQECGMAATAKHFPGDGVDDRNQHYVTTCNSLSYEEWKNSFGSVYEAAINAGVKSIMTAHIYFPGYYYKIYQNPDINQIMPGSLSYELNTKLLREELKFNGLIVTDATGMVGFKSLGKKEELIPKCINSGVDMFLFARDRKSDFEIMFDAAKRGIITEERLESALYRILALKASLKLHEKKLNGNLIPPKSSLKIVGCKKHNQWAENCAENSITLVKDNQKIIPIDRALYRKILLIKSGDFNFITWKFKRLMKKVGFKIKSYNKITHITNKNIDLVLYLFTESVASNRNNLLVNIKKIGGMEYFADKFPTILISLANPYHLYEFPRIKTVINAYAPFPIVIKTLVQKLIGNQEFKGINPVNAFCNIFDSKL